MGQGFKDAGFYCRYNVEKDFSAVATLRCNHQLDGIFGEEAIVFDEDVETFLQKVHDKDPAYPRMGDVDQVHASPPCQGFSAANRSGGKNEKDQQRADKDIHESRGDISAKDCILRECHGYAIKKEQQC